MVNEVRLLGYLREAPSVSHTPNGTAYTLIHDMAALDALDGSGAAVALAQELADLAFGFRPVLAPPQLHGDHPDCPSLPGDSAEELPTRRRQRNHHDVVLVMAPRVLTLDV